MSGETKRSGAERIVKASRVPGALFGPRPAGEQVYPGDLPIFQNGLPCGRVFVASGEEFWITYTQDDVNGKYEKYETIANGNELTFGSGNTPELAYAHEVIYNRASDPTSFAAYRAKLPSHACVSWAVTTPGGLPSSAPGSVYKVFQGTGSGNAWVGYAVLDTLEHHWVLFSQSGANGETKFNYIQESTVASYGNLQFTSATLPPNLSVTYDHVKCAGTTVA
jgi:hypothetical protein